VPENAVLKKQAGFMTMVAAFTCGLACSAEVPARKEPQPVGTHYTGPVFDVHLHATPIRGAARPNPVSGEEPAKTSAQLLAAVTRECQEHRIVRAVIHGPVEELPNWIQAAPGKFISAPMILQGQPAPAIDMATLRREILSGAIVGEITAQYVGLVPSDPVLAPYWALAEELDAPVMVHMGTSFPRTANSGRPNFRVRLGDPLLLEDVLVRHPKLRLWVAHGGLPFEQEMFALLDQYPEVYMDVAVTNWIGGMSGRAAFHDFLYEAINRGFGKRIMFGSDQMSWPDAIGLAIEGVDSAPFLTNEQKADIFYRNAMRFFRLEESATRR
jgi:uncharacterized protein